jgi:hypothetical protein
VLLMPETSIEVATSAAERLRQKSPRWKSKATRAKASTSPSA